MFRANPGESTPYTAFWYSGSPMLFLILHSQKPMRSSRQMSTVDGVDLTAFPFDTHSLSSGLLNPIVWMRNSLEESKSKRQPTVCQNPANTDIVILCIWRRAFTLIVETSSAQAYLRILRGSFAQVSLT